jgi:hypothetical protein
MHQVIGTIRHAAFQIATRSKLVVTTLAAGLVVWAIARILILYA